MLLVPQFISAMNVRNTTESHAAGGSPPASAYTLIKATFVHTPTLEDGLQISPNTLVGFNYKGEIDYISFNNEQTDRHAIIETFKMERENSTPHIDYHYFDFIDYSKDQHKFICPGFVDTHIHASQYPNIGIGLGAPLLDWLKEYTFALENQFMSGNKNHLTLAKEVYSKVINKTLSCGTTCASYFTTIDTDTTNLFADLLMKFGQRGFVGKVCMDHNDEMPQYQESNEDTIASMNKIIAHCNSINPKDEVLVKPIITPRFAPVCSRKLLKSLGKIASTEKLPVQTHISENKDEIKLVSELFPECDNYASVYDDHDLLNSNTILAHAIHLTNDECHLIKEKNCSISHCPTSNTFISSGEAPIKKYLYQYKLNVSLGTDLSGGFEQSILGVLKYSILVSHHLSMKENKLEMNLGKLPVGDVLYMGNKEEKEMNKLSVSDAFYMATQGGAAAVGLADKIGSFAMGKKFDAQLIDLASVESNVDVFSWQLPDHKDDHDLQMKKITNLINKWIFSGDDRNCVKVWCNGNVVVDKAKKESWVLVDEAISKD